jgi:hypothetical protein
MLQGLNCFLLAELRPGFLCVSVYACTNGCMYLCVHVYRCVHVYIHG